MAGAHVADGYINGHKMETSSFIRNTVECKKGSSELFAALAKMALSFLWFITDYEVMYRTGDYGRIIDGNLYYEGRADSQIKVRGHRVDVTEINAVVQGLDQIAKGVVLCYKPGQPEQVNNG